MKEGSRYGIKSAELISMERFNII